MRFSYPPVENISMNMYDYLLSETEPSFFDTTIEEELISQTSMDLLDKSILNSTSDCLTNESK